MLCNLSQRTSRVTTVLDITSLVLRDRHRHVDRPRPHHLARRRHRRVVLGPVAHAPRVHRLDLSTDLDAPPRAMVDLVDAKPLARGVGLEAEVLVHRERDRHLLTRRGVGLGRWPDVRPGV